MTNKKKIIISSCILVGALSLTALGSLSLLTANTEISNIATLGTVQVQLDDLSISNSQTILPGDKPEDHELSYRITNIGTKSISTRQTIILSASTNTDKYIDASYLSLYHNDGTEVKDKKYVLLDGTTKETLEAGDVVIGVKYVFFGDSFNGSENASILEENEDYKKYYEIEIDSKGSKGEFVVSNSKGDVTQVYNFGVKLDEKAPSSYKDASINIGIGVEAMQYRDTNLTDWSEAASVTRSLVTQNVKTLPTYKESADGSLIINEE